MLPAWLKIAYAIYVGILVPTYWWAHDAQQFLWFSNIAFLLTAVAVWKESSLLASMMAVGVLCLELAWNVGFFAGLFFGIDYIPGTAYMFDPSTPLFLRLLSLYHVPLPFLCCGWSIDSATTRGPCPCRPCSAGPCFWSASSSPTNRETSMACTVITIPTSSRYRRSSG